MAQNIQKGAQIRRHLGPGHPNSGHSGSLVPSECSIRVGASHRRAGGGGVLPRLAGLVITWWRDPDFSHGFLVPIFAGYLVWAQEKNPSQQRYLRPPGAGLLVVALAARGPAPRGFRRQSFPVTGFPGGPVGRTGAFFGWVAASQGTSLRVAGPAPGHPIPAIIFNQINPSAADCGF